MELIFVLFSNNSSLMADCHRKIISASVRLVNNTHRHRISEAAYFIHLQLESFVRE